jgi:hypothetical protein
MLVEMFWVSMVLQLGLVVKVDIGLLPIDGTRKERRKKVVDEING